MQCRSYLFLLSCFLLPKDHLNKVSFLIVCVVQVPPELKEDLMLIADKIEPYLLQVKEQADKIPEKAHELAGKIQPAAEKLGDQIEQGASKVLSHAHAHAKSTRSFKLLQRIADLFRAIASTIL